MSFSRPSGRQPDQMRDVSILRNYTRHAEGSVLVSFGHTRVLCTASVDNKVPGFLRGKGEGWVTAEYGMLPRSPHTRSAREAARGRGVGRALIGAVYDSARAAQSSRVYWQTHETNAAGRQLYDKLAKHHGFIVYAQEL